MKAKYVDGFVLVIKKKNVAAYRRMAAEGCKIWKRYGALDYKECAADDMRPKGVVLTFTKLAKAKTGEVVFFSFITYKSRAHRDAVNKRVMTYFSKKYSDKDQEKGMPFDMKRMAYGGFKVIVSS